MMLHTKYKGSIRPRGFEQEDFLKFVLLVALATRILDGIKIFEQQQL